MEKKRGKTDMKFFKKNLKPWLCLIICIAIVSISMGFAHGIQTGFGKIDVSSGLIDTTYQSMDGKTRQGKIAYKLYVPKSASDTNKKGAVLLLHGYQNDHET